MENTVPPEVQFLSDWRGGALTIAVSLLAFAAMLWWAGRPGAGDRWAVVASGIGAALLVSAITFLAVNRGWWGGAFFTVPLPVQLAIYLPLQAAGYAAWTGGYLWLARRHRHALLLYAAVVLAFIPIIWIADQLNIARGQVTLGGGYSVWHDVLSGQVALWSPLLLYWAVRRWRPGRSTGIPGKTG